MYYVNFPRVSAVVAAAAIAPTVLFASPAVAASGTPSAATSAPDKASDVKPNESADAASAEEDRIAILRILADENIGKGLRTAAQKALNGTAQDMRHFLETGQYKARDEDNRFAILKILAQKDTGRGVREAAEKAMNGTPEDRVRFLKSGWRRAKDEDDRVRVAQIIHSGGPSVKAAGRKALDGTAEDIRHFLEVGQYEARAADDRVRAVQIYSVGGPAVKAAAKKALRGTPEDIRHFLEVGQYEARAEDKAAEDAAKKKPAPETADDANAKPDNDGKATKVTTDDRPKQVSGEVAKPAAVSSRSSITPPGGSGELASTGAGSVTSWAVGGTAIALGAGAGLIVASRRRTSVEH
ncbi:ALF repeat-containing protein [Streptomyces sp. NPDC048483]|uniref:ALF repeat-containing protein n=1 Tax=Streptomyces sp. NPDC048483 TaxID=3154927 RepID=UPI003448EC08